MATVNEVVTTPESGGLSGYEKTVALVTWTPLTETNADGRSVGVAGFTTLCVHIKGTFGILGTCVLEGSNDDTTWKTLTDLQGNAISAIAEAIEAVQERPLRVRPRVTAGTGVSLTVLLVGG